MNTAEFQNQNKERNNTSFLYYLAAQENKPFSPIDDRMINSIGVISLISAICYGVVFMLYIDSYLNRLPVTFVLGIIFTLFCLFLNRTLFLFGSGKTKMISIIIYLVFYILLGYTLSYYFLLFYLETEIANYSKNQTQLENFEAIIKVISHLNSKQKSTVSDFRLLITFILWCLSLLPLINYLWFTKNHVDYNNFETQNSAIIDSIQNKILKKKQEYAELISNPYQVNSDDPFNDSPSDSKSLAIKREELMQEIIHLERSLQIL